MQAIPGVPHLYNSGEDDGGDGDGAAALNPATWMLDISTPASEDAIGVDFAAIYSKSSLARSACNQQSTSCVGNIIPYIYSMYHHTHKV